MFTFQMLPPPTIHHQKFRTKVLEIDYHQTHANLNLSVA